MPKTMEREKQISPEALPAGEAAFIPPESGLSAAEVEGRRVIYGFNEITAKKPSATLKFLGFFWGPIPIMIEVAAIIAVIIHHLEDLYIIHALVRLKSGVGF
jgi:H+-transporting ATPase